MEMELLQIFLWSQFKKGYNTLKLLAKIDEYAKSEKLKRHNIMFISICSVCIKNTVRLIFCSKHDPKATVILTAESS